MAPSAVLNPDVPFCTIEHESACRLQGGKDVVPAMHHPPSGRSDGEKVGMKIETANGVIDDHAPTHARVPRLVDVDGVVWCGESVKKEDRFREGWSTAAHRRFAGEPLAGPVPRSESVV
jgi:hypothetical protein